jgi:energy-coupling factor transporter ATP-binding protein EcfA2
MSGEAATPKQKRALTFMRRGKQKDLVEKMLIERGGSIEDLSKWQASEIISAAREAENEQKGGEQQKQENDQKNDQKNEQDEQKKGGDLEDENRRQNRRSGFRPGSKQEIIANALRANNMDPEATRKALADQIGMAGALTFTQNQNGGRVPYPMGSPDDDGQQLTQFGRALKTIFAVRRSLINGGQGEQKQKNEDKRKHEQKQENNQEKQNREAVELLAWVRQLREFCRQRDADGHPIDEIGLRPSEYGAAMLKGGIPLQAIKHAITMHYPPEARRALGVRDYDVQQFHVEDRIEGVHAALPYLMTLTSCRDFDGYRLPAALVGPKGTGKTTLARQLASVIREVEGLDKFDFGMVSMTSGTSPSAFNGRPRIADNGSSGLVAAIIAQAQYDASFDDEGHQKTATAHLAAAMRLAQKAYAAGDVVMSVFERIYRNGGVFLFDEMDAADENLLLGVNSALANGVFANPATGEIVERHPDFIPVAGMNTLGLGGGRDYKARNALDAATLDRWNAGRIQMTLDPRIEESLYWAIINR